MSRAGDEGYNFYRLTQDLPPPEACRYVLLPIPEGGRILDLGAGTGRFASAFKRDRPDLIVDALEYNPEALSYLRSRQGINILPIRMEDFCGSRLYDAIWANHSLFFLKPDTLSDVMENLRSALKSSGRLYLTFLKKDEKPDPFPGSPMRLSEPELRDLCLCAGFHIEGIREHDARFGKDQKLATYFIVHATPLTTS